MTSNLLSIKELFSRTTIEIDSPSEISRSELSSVLNEFSFAVIRGLINPDKIRLSKEKLINSFVAGSDAPATGEHPRDIMNNFQKLSIGGAEHSGVYRPRCMRTFYNPIWSDDIYGMRKCFELAARVRNIIYGLDEYYAIDKIEDGFWTASRIHNYPRGGGFLVSHVDDVVPVVQKASGISKYFQPVIVMSKKGKGIDCDFESGGGFFEINNARYYYEEEARLGDIIIYSGATIHGVADIDLHKTFDTRDPSGRFAGFVTLYKEFTRKRELEKYLSFPKKHNITK